MSDKDQTQVSTATDAGDAGYNKALKNRHIQMIAIGTGLFLGAGGRLAQGGPALAFAYAVCGIFAFLMVRALGELAVRRPSSGAFVSYAREFLGEKGAFITGWFFFLDWAVTVMADITAVALYMHYWNMFENIPQWVIALIALGLVFVLNMMSVKAFGEAEFWFALIKVATILIFMGVAIWAILTQAHVGEYTAGVHNIAESGGWFPEGLAPVFALALLFFTVVVSSNVMTFEGRWTLALFAVVIVLMVAGWYYVRDRVGNLTDEAAASLQGEETLVAGE